MAALGALALAGEWEKTGRLKSALRRRVLGNGGEVISIRIGDTKGAADFSGQIVFDLGVPRDRFGDAIGGIDPQGVG